MSNPSESTFGRVYQNLMNKLEDQVWFQQIKAKYDELPPQTKYTLKLSCFSAIIASFGFVVFTLAVGAIEKKNEYQEKLALIQKISNSQDELRRLKETTSRAHAEGDTTPWNDYLQGQISSLGIEAEGVSVSTPKKAPSNPKSPTLIESADIDVTLKKMNIRQLVKLIFNIENGSRIAKIKQMNVTAQPDESGYLDLTMTVTGYTLAKAK